MDLSTELNLDLDLPTDFLLAPDICKTCCGTKKCLGSERQFLKAISIWINKPHVVNRRLTGSKILAISHCETADEVVRALQKHVASLTNPPLQCQEETTFDIDLSEEPSPFVIILRELIPKSEHFPILVEATLFDSNAQKVTFIPCGGSLRPGEANKPVSKEVSYCVQYQRNSNETIPKEETNSVTISWKCDHKEKAEFKQQLTSSWLQSVLLDKLVSWSQVQDIQTSPTSLKLVTVDRYKDVYLHLKNKYGKDLVKNWTERTDPKKFVYEDIAIAAYLMLIWEEERRSKDLLKKQSFVDLGCGNGLLVYILSKEGYKGLGIDLKKRKIWDTFGDCVALKVESITPSADHLFPECDWIIGNHSDELTPWIPVIAARSSYACNFFVLPCCHHDFVGKFSRPEKGKSQYSSYLEYIELVIKKCGFYPEKDVLRIPSTKRTCFIGRKRDYEQKDEEIADSSRQIFIENQINRQCSKAKFNQISSTSHNVNEAKNSSGSNRIEMEGEECDDTHSPTSKRRFDDLNNRLESFERDIADSGETDGHARSQSPRFISYPPTKVVRLDGGEISNIHEEKGTTSQESHRVGILSSKERTSEETSQQSCSTVKPASWAPNFQARAEQTNRNCQRVPEAVKLKIVETVFQLVLDADKSACDTSRTAGEWRKGGVVPISEAVNQFEKEILAELKSECGGFQTLLRNHGHIFQVTKGQIQLRDFTKTDPWEGQNPHKAKGKKRDTSKTTLCWFFDHHPDGCPRDKESCKFAHGKDDLQEKKCFPKVD